MKMEENNEVGEAGTLHEKQARDPCHLIFSLYFYFAVFCPFLRHSLALLFSFA